MTDPVSQTRWRCSSGTHVGHRREINEDAILSVPEGGIWAVSDGMGGHTAGDLASQLVTEALASIPTSVAPVERMRQARAALHKAHDDIQCEALRRGGVTIGATVVVLIVSEQHFVCLWAGDSRLYRLRDGVLHQLSTDHSIVGELIKAGHLTEDEAEHHPHANQITRAVGIGDRLEIDKRRGELARGDRFLLCSDGLTKHVGDTELADLLDQADAERSAETLIQRALDHGGADNVSVIVVEV